MMKKAFFVVLAVLTLAACDKESYRHAISVSRPYSGQYGVAYADQTLDSIVFETFDSYRASSNASWLTLDPQMAEQKIPNSYWNMWQIVLPFSLSPNTTNETRDAIVSVNNYGDDDWNQTVQVSYLQLGWLNITRPAAAFEAYTSFPRTAEFELTDSATQAADSLVFSVYADWTLSCTSSFVHLATTSGKAGKNVVNLTLDANEGTADRTDTIKLVSNGVTTPIALKQTGKKE